MEKKKINKLRNDIKVDSNLGSLDCESGILSLNNYAPCRYAMYHRHKHAHNCIDNVMSLSDMHKAACLSPGNIFCMSNLLSLNNLVNHSSSFNFFIYNATVTMKTEETQQSKFLHYYTVYNHNNRCKATVEVSS